jgi:hypothetical protein
MGVDVAHLVLEALGDADDHVVDERADCAEGGDVLAVAVVHLDVDDALAWVREADIDMTEILLELAARALDGDLAGLDVDADCARVCVSVLSSLSPSTPPRTCIWCMRAGIACCVRVFWVSGCTHLPRAH